MNDLDQKNKDSLLRGNFDEEESSRCFQQALNEWRASNTHGDREHQEPNHNVQTARPGNTHTPQCYIRFMHIRLNHMPLFARPRVSLIHHVVIVSHFSYAQMKNLLGNRQM